MGCERWGVRGGGVRGGGERWGEEIIEINTVSGSFSSLIHTFFAIVRYIIENCMSDVVTLLGILPSNVA